MKPGDIVEVRAIGADNFHGRYVVLGARGDDLMLARGDTVDALDADVDVWMHSRRCERVYTAPDAFAALVCLLPYCKRFYARFF
jgi:hypothetical protein